MRDKVLCLLACSHSFSVNRNSFSRTSGPSATRPQPAIFQDETLLFSSRSLTNYPFASQVPSLSYAKAYYRQKRGLCRRYTCRRSYESAGGRDSSNVLELPRETDFTLQWNLQTRMDHNSKFKTKQHLHSLTFMLD